MLSGLSGFVEIGESNQLDPINGGTPFELDMGVDGTLTDGMKAAAITALSGIASVVVITPSASGISITGKSAGSFPTVAAFRFALLQAIGPRIPMNGYTLKLDTATAPPSGGVPPIDPVPPPPNVSTIPASVGGINTKFLIAGALIVLFVMSQK